MVLQLAAASSFPRDDEQADPVAQCKAVGHRHHYDGDGDDHQEIFGQEICGQEVLREKSSSEIICRDMYPKMNILLILLAIQVLEKLEEEVLSSPTQLSQSKR